MQAIQKLNARIRADPWASYFCSTHFWGPVSNYGIPLAAIMDTQKSPELISGTMTGALCVYSATFMRYSMAITPRNSLLFSCHLINECSQLVQLYRWTDYNKWGGRERALKDQAKGVVNDATKVDGKEKTMLGATDGINKLKSSEGTN